jgi:hypothetical protein
MQSFHDPLRAGIAEKVSVHSSCKRSSKLHVRRTVAESGPSHLTSGTDEIDLFRFFDTAIWVTGFWGQRFDVRAVINEAARLMPSLDEEDYVGTALPDGWDEIVAIWAPAGHGAEPVRTTCRATHGDSDVLGRDRVTST